MAANQTPDRDEIADAVKRLEGLRKAAERAEPRPEPS